MERLDRGEQVVVGEHHALRRAGRARGEDQLPDLVRARARPGRDLPPPSRAGTSSSGLGRESLDGRRRERGPARPRAGRARRVRCRGSVARRRRARRFRRSHRRDMRRSSGTRTARPASPRSRRPGGPASTGDQVRIRSPGFSPSARSRHAASRLRRSSSRKRPVQSSCRRRARRARAAGRSPKRGRVVEQVEERFPSCASVRRRQASMLVTGSAPRRSLGVGVDTD